MIQIKNIARKLSRGLKSKLAILAFAVVTIVVSSGFTVVGLYLYGQAHPNIVAPVNISKTTTSPNKVSTTTAAKNPSTQTAKTNTTTTTTSAPKPVATVEPVVVIQPVTPAPSSSVDNLTSAPSDSSSATAVSIPASDTSTNPIRVSTTTYASTNWSGYLATGGNFTVVSGSWAVPTVTGETGTKSDDGTWIGIGGVTSNDLIQVGTLDQVAADGTVSSNIFYEILPAEAMVVDMPIKSGDVMSASVTETSLNLWLIVINDITNGNTFSKSLSYNSSHSSAEWIEEDPSYLSGSLMPFANFGTVTFSGCKATVDSYLYGIADIGASPITMVARRSPIAVPSAISGSGFSVTRN